MKQLAFTALFLGASAAFAFPAIGDRADYVGTLTLRDGSVLQIEKSKEIVGQNSASEWMVQETVTVAGHTKVETEAEDDLLSTAAYSQLLANCERHSGELKDLTVPAGEFKTCLMSETEADGDTTQKWISDVPFGLVQKIEFDADDGTTKVMQLKSFRSLE